MKEKMDKEFGAGEGPTIIAYFVMRGTDDECLVVDDEESGGYRLLSQEEIDEARDLYMLQVPWVDDDTEPGPLVHQIDRLPTKGLQAKVRVHKAEMEKAMQERYRVQVNG